MRSCETQPGSAPAPSLANHKDDTPSLAPVHPPSSVLQAQQQFVFARTGTRPQRWTRRNAALRARVGVSCRTLSSALRDQMGKARHAHSHVRCLEPRALEVVIRHLVRDLSTRISSVRSSLSPADSQSASTRLSSRAVPPAPSPSCPAPAPCGSWAFHSAHPSPSPECCRSE